MGARPHVEDQFHQGSGCCRPQDGCGPFANVEERRPLRCEAVGVNDLREGRWVWTPVRFLGLRPRCRLLGQTRQLWVSFLSELYASGDAEFIRDR